MSIQSQEVYATNHREYQVKEIELENQKKNIIANLPVGTMLFSGSRLRLNRTRCRHYHFAIPRFVLRGVSS